jgi:hypothetical protein
LDLLNIQKDVEGAQKELSEIMPESCPLWQPIKKEKKNDEIHPLTS